MLDQSNSSVKNEGSTVGDENQEPGTKKDVVAYETHRRLLDEKKKLQEKYEALASKDKVREEDDAKKRGDFDAILKSREEELKSTRDELTSIRETIKNAQKLTAVLSTAGSPIESKWHGLIDTSKILINPDSGEVDQMSVTKVVEDLRKSWPEMFKNPNAPKLPADAPLGNSAGKINRSEWLNLPEKEMRKWKMEQIIDN